MGSSANFTQLDQTIRLLLFLFGFIRLWTPTLMDAMTPEFVNHKLSIKLTRQLNDALTLCSNTLPPWCSFLMNTCPFLFTFENKKAYFRSSQLGIARALHSLQNSILVVNDDQQNEEFRVGRIVRQKVRISREGILASAFKVFELFGCSKTVLEVEFRDEVGTGLGPTLEYFTLVSHQFQRSSLRMWHCTGMHNVAIYELDKLIDSDKPQMVFHPNGLYPSILKESDESVSQILDLFELFGVFIAKALLDYRMVDIPLSDTFLKWMVSAPVGIEDLVALYPEIGKVVTKLLELIDKPSSEQLLDGSRIDDLGLDFSVMNWDLIPNGSQVMVSSENIKQYCDRMMEVLLVEGVTLQMNAFKRGFDRVFPISSLYCFSVSELSSLLLGCNTNRKEEWTVQSILDGLKCDHHYSRDSKPVQYLAQAISELDPYEKQQFMTFLTGFPKLPVGGLKALVPPFTVVRKDIQGVDPDTILPSVMTCVNYLKLPPYSCVEITKSRLLTAITEGLSSFHLS